MKKEKTMSSNLLKNMWLHENSPPIMQHIK